MTSTLQSPKIAYLEARIRDGFTSEDVRLWQSLCRQCETELGESVQFMWTIMDIARHNKSSVLDVIKTGRLCSDQKAVNEKFMQALFLAVSDDNDLPDEVDDDDDVDDKPAVKVLDLTAEESLSGSYEETSEKYYDSNDNPTSAQAYEIDGFVVEDTPEPTWAPSIKRWLFEINGELIEDECIHGICIDESCSECRAKGPPSTRVKVSGLARSNALVGKRKLRQISTDEE